MSQALILWEPRYLFFPPVQEPPPPTRVFRHVDLLEEEEEEVISRERRRPFFGPITPQIEHTPDHEFLFPQLYLNDTFLRFIRNLPKQLPLPLIDLSLSSQGNYYTHRSYRNHYPPVVKEAFIEEIQSDTANQIEEEEEKESSLESIDENDTTIEIDFSPSPPRTKRTKQPTKITLKRKSPISNYDQDDVFSSNYQIENSTNSPKRLKTDEEASMEQWRVGKRPGFQGSFIAPKKNYEENEDEDGSSRKRTFSQSITSSAERVLKKPFKPPTQVPIKRKIAILPGSTDSSPYTSPSSLNSTPSNITHTYSTSSSNRISIPKVDPFFPDFPTPPSSGSSTSKSRNVKPPAKPFKTPLRTNRSSAPSPSTKPNRPTIQLSRSTLRTTSNEGSNKENKSDDQKITNLQEEIRITKQAIKYKNEDEDEKLSELILIWRTAGREIVEKLFMIIPKPIDFGESSTSSMNTPSSYTGYNSNSSTLWNTPSSEGILNTPELTEEQLEWMRNANRNENGEIVDDEGNSIIMGESEKEVKMFWDGLGKGTGIQSSSRSRGWSNQTHYGSYSTHDSNETSPSYQPSNITEIEVESEIKSQGWNYSSLMKLCNVDPDLLGWNDSEEDWNE